jgi:hypothetical protein
MPAKAQGTPSRKRKAVQTVLQPNRTSTQVLLGNIGLRDDLPPDFVQRALEAMSRAGFDTEASLRRLFELHLDPPTPKFAETLNGHGVPAIIYSSLFCHFKQSANDAKRARASSQQIALDMIADADGCRISWPGTAPIGGSSSGTSWCRIVQAATQGSKADLAGKCNREVVLAAANPEAPPPKHPTGSGFALALQVATKACVRTFLADMADSAAELQYIHDHHEEASFDGDATRSKFRDTLNCWRAKLQHLCVAADWIEQDEYAEFAPGVSYAAHPGVTIFCTCDE